MNTVNAIANVAKSGKNFTSVVADYKAKKTNYIDVMTKVNSSAARIQPTLVNDKFGFVDKETGFSYKPTKHCINQLSQKLDSSIGSYGLNKLFNSDDPRKHRILKDLVEISFQEDTDNKDFLFRLNNSDNTCRAFLSDRYAVVNNDWVLETVQKFLPTESLNCVAKDKSEDDFLNFDIVIPNTFRSEDDSDYGGMIKVTNSEIGTHRLTIQAGVFRLICTNGAIGFKQAMEAINLVHRGRIDLNHLEYQLKTGIESHILAMPSLIQGFTKMKGMVLGNDGASMTPLFASVAQAYKLTKVEIEATHTGWGIERNETPRYAKTLFGITNAITRGSQRLPESSWNKLNEVGGKLASYDDGEWRGLQAKANALTVKDTETILGKDLIFA